MGRRTTEENTEEGDGMEGGDAQGRSLKLTSTNVSAYTSAPTSFPSRSLMS